jgi:uncharacterized membrane protein
VIMASQNKLSGIVKRYFLSGVLVVVPLILTYLVLRLLFDAVDGTLQPILHYLLGYYIPGLGILVTLMLIFLAGLLTRNFVGARIYRIGDDLLAKVPIIRPIYSSAKQLLTAITKPSMSSFKEVALIEYPRLGCYVLAFVSNRITLESNGKKRRLASVFVPSTPTPVTGWTVLVPVEELTVLHMTIEVGVKFLVSGGVASPDLVANDSGGKAREDGEVIGETC